MTTAYEFAEVSRVASPHAITKVHTRNPPNEASLLFAEVKCATGQNITAPSEYSDKPMRMVNL
jgi:hypothetical protein